MTGAPNTGVESIITQTSRRCYSLEEDTIWLFITTLQTIAQDFIKEAQAKYKDKIVVEVNIICILLASPLLLDIIVTSKALADPSNNILHVHFKSGGLS